MKIEEEKRLEKYGWMYERESLAKEMNSIAPALTSGDGPKPIQGGGAKAITDGGEGEKDGRGQIKMWDYTAKNTLMYIPDGAGETTKDLIKKRNDKIIRHGNTRLTSDFLRKMSSVGGGGTGQVSLPESAKEKVGIDGKAVHASDSPQVNGYGFVATPQIRPGKRIKIIIIINYFDEIFIPLLLSTSLSSLFLNSPLPFSPLPPLSLSLCPPLKVLMPPP